jgi:hypothetical protein
LTKSFCAHPHLFWTFFSGNIKNAVRSLGHVKDRLKHQGRLANSWLTPQQNNRAWDHSLAQYPVELSITRWGSSQLQHLNICQRSGFSWI